jgi:hypothetical protein
MNHVDVRTRKDFPALIDAMGLKKGVELGVWRAEHSDYLLSNSHLDKLWSIDAWCDDTDKVKATFKNWTVADGGIEQHFQTAKNTLSKYGDRSEIIRGISWEQAPKFEDGSLDFIYIDASHRYSGVSYDLLAWWPKLRHGGVFAGHDYVYKYRYEVMEAVNGFMCEEQQILRITHEDQNTPPSWWCEREKILRKDWGKRVAEAMPWLLSQQDSLRSRGIVVVLPYQYHVLSGRDAR